MNSVDHSSSARRFYGIAGALCLAVGNAIRPGFIQAAMALLVVGRIGRVRRILLGLEARFLAGALVLRAPGVRVAAAAVRRRPVAGSRLPRRLGWLCPLVPSDAACYAGQLRVVLAEPGMRDLLAACPQAVRTLGPLCRMLGIAKAEFAPADKDRIGSDVAGISPRALRRDWAAADEVEGFHFGASRVTGRPGLPDG